MEEFLERYKINRLYAYHQAEKDDGTIEFGWVESDKISLEGPVVFSRAPDHPEVDNAVTLSDYHTYFTRLTSLTPDEFINKWESSPEEFETYWYANKPRSEDGFHNFVMSLSYLIRDKKPFEHKFVKHLGTFEVLESF